jgi:hypothetical protein
MQITITPNDIIERCLWTEYRKFCLSDKTETEVNDIVTENKPFIINENDAYVIGLIKIIETDNLTHRFKQHMNELIDIRSIVDEGNVYINKSILMKESISFKDRFPISYNPDLSFKKSLEEMNNYINKTVKQFDSLEVVEVKRKIRGQIKKYNCVKSIQVAKIIKL